MKIPSSNLGRTCCVHNMFSPCSAKRRASDKDLPVQRVREGKTIKNIEKLTGAEILFLLGNQGRKPRKLEIRGSPDDVKLAEEFLRTFFKHKNPSRGSDGLNPGVLKVWFVVGSCTLIMFYKQHCK